MSKLVYLHLGTHKTGTTAIQAYFADHTKELRRNGIVFLQPRVLLSDQAGTKRRRNSDLFAEYFLREELVTGTRFQARSVEVLQARAETAAASIKHVILNTDFEHYFISTESFCLMRTTQEQARLQAYFDYLDCKVQPIVVFRNEADWRQSFNAQLARFDYANCHATVPDPRHRMDSDWYYNTKEIIDFWTAFARPEVISYDQEMLAEGSIIPSMFRTLGMTPPGDYREYILNTRDNSGRKQRAADRASRSA